MKEARGKDHILYVWFRLYEMSRICQSTETERRLVVDWGWGTEITLTINQHKRSFGGDENVLKLDCRQVIQLYKLTKIIDIYR